MRLKWKKRVLKCLGHASLVISIFSLCVAIYALDAGRGQTQVASQLREYLSAFEKIGENYADKNVISIEGYRSLDDIQRQRIVILAGLLIGVVDIMHQTGDKRADRWATYIKLYAGPLACYPEIDAYAATSLTLNVVKQEMANYRVKAVSCNRLSSS